ncbi:MAG: hypothetical protein M3Q33_08810 [Acidobacteriota bacterium]|nr:hypothetical protein [Acidobacteriota bacterium]
MKKTYPSDLTDSQWNHIKEFFEQTIDIGKSLPVKNGGAIESLSIRYWNLTNK